MQNFVNYILQNCCKISKNIRNCQIFFKKNAFFLHISEKNCTFVHFFGKMESNNDIKTSPSPVNHAMLFGLETGVFFAFKFILQAEAQQSGSGWLVALYYLLTLYIIYGIIRSALHYRMTDCGGTITFGQAYRYILLLFVFSSIVAALVRVIYLKWIDGSYLVRLGEQMQKVMEMNELKVSEAERTALQEALPEILKPVRFSLYYIFLDVFMGIVAGLLLAGPVKNIKVKEIKR